MHSVPLKVMAESHWAEANRERFSAAWLAELAEVPQFSESTIHVVAGLLLPIWKRLPNESSRVYRLQTDAGERIIGRKVSAAWVANGFSCRRRTDADAGYGLRRGADGGSHRPRPRRRSPDFAASGVMGAYRIELSGFTDTMRDRLRTYVGFLRRRSSRGSCACSCHQTLSGAEVLAKLLDRYRGRADW